MEAMKWRSRSKTVAFIDVVFSSLGLVLLSTLFLGHTEEFIRRSYPSTRLAIQWALNLAGLILSCFSVFIAVMLFNATKPETDPKKALNSAKLWRNGNMVFLAIGIVNCIAYVSLLGLIITVGFRCTCIHIVSEFMAELKAVIAQDSLQAKDPVVEMTVTDSKADTTKHVDELHEDVKINIE